MYNNIEEFDKVKTKVLKYIMYKKRTEREVLQKFSSSVDQNLLEDVIEHLKEIGYIDDENYIERAVNEFMSINTLSGHFIYPSSLAVSIIFIILLPHTAIFLLCSTAEFTIC